MSGMVVGIGRITLRLDEIASLKEKRGIVRRLIDRAQNRFNASIAEVGDLDSKRSVQIGVSVVSNDRRHADRMLASVIEFIDAQGLAVVYDQSTELVTSGDDDPVHGRSLASRQRSRGDAFWKDIDGGE
ncbi:MAG: DUF503 domain-containing protein [Myxococcota bacterium]